MQNITIIYERNACQVKNVTVMLLIVLAEAALR
jgi:hypothetical protein